MSFDFLGLAARIQEPFCDFSGKGSKKERSMIGKRGCHACIFHGNSSFQKMQKSVLTTLARADWGQAITFLALFVHLLFSCLAAFLCRFWTFSWCLAGQFSGTGGTPLNEFNCGSFRKFIMNCVRSVSGLLPTT